MTAEKPILFSAEMVRAILDGRKVQTRRVVKPQPTWSEIGGEKYFTWQKGNKGWNTCHEKWFQKHLRSICPFDADRLWVRETWATDLHYEQHSEQYSPSTIAKLCLDAGYHHVTPEHPPCPLWYRADDTYRRWGDFDEVRGKWRSSIHMPRWASRINLEIVDIRVERLQDISEDDAAAEGICDDIIPACGDHPDLIGYGLRGRDTPLWPTASEAFANLWDSINGKKHPWNSNPWVWIVEFKRMAQ